MYKKEGISEDMYCIRDDDGLMLKIAHNYMKLMGIEDTQFIIADHIDCYRNEKVCKMLTAHYRLYFTEGKEHVNFMRLYFHDKVKYFI